MSFGAVYVQRLWGPEHRAEVSPHGVCSETTVRAFSDGENETDCVPVLGMRNEAGGILCGPPVALAEIVERGLGSAKQRIL